MTFNATVDDFQVGMSNNRCFPLVEGKFSQTGIVTCSLCSMKSLQGMEQHIFEDNVKKPVCPLCHCALHLDAAKDHGVMIWLPEMSQGELNSVVSTLFATLINHQNNPTLDDESAKLRTLYKVMVSRTQPLIKLFGAQNPMFDATSPMFLAQQIDSAKKVFAKRFTTQQFKNQINGLRFLANESSFANYYSGVAQYMSKKLPRDSWGRHLDSAITNTERQLSDSHGQAN